MSNEQLVINRTLKSDMSDRSDKSDSSDHPITNYSLLIANC